MARKSPIKWRPQDTKKLNTYIRKFNAAITRLEKKNPGLEGTGVLPERLVKSELVTRINTRDDFNREMRKIDRLFKKGAQEIKKDSSGFYTTVWSQREERYLQQRINKQRRAVIEKYQIPKAQWQFLGLEPVDFKAQREKAKRKSLGAEPEDQANIIQDFYNFLYTAERETSDDYYTGMFAKLRNAYLKAIDLHLPKDKGEELKALLEENQIWGSDIVYAISQNDILDFEYYYSLEDAEQKAILLLDRWKQMIPNIVKQRKREFK